MLLLLVTRGAPAPDTTVSGAARHVPGVVRAKGALLVEAFCKRGDSVFPVKDGDDFVAGDRLRFAYTKDQAGVLLVFGVDDAGRLSPTTAMTHWPVWLRLLVPRSCCPSPWNWTTTTDGKGFLPFGRRTHLGRTSFAGPWRMRWPRSRVTSGRRLAFLSRQSKYPFCSGGRDHGHLGAWACHYRCHGRAGMRYARVMSLRLLGACLILALGQGAALAQAQQTRMAVVVATIWGTTLPAPFAMPRQKPSSWPACFAVRVISTALSPSRGRPAIGRSGPGHRAVAARSRARRGQADPVPLLLLGPRRSGGA